MKGIAVLSRILFYSLTFLLQNKLVMYYFRILCSQKQHGIQKNNALFNWHLLREILCEISDTRISVIAIRTMLPRNDLRERFFFAANSEQYLSSGLYPLST